NFGSMEDTVFCGVFDGHGPYGHTLLTSIVKAYRFMDKELKMQVDVDCLCSGTTAVTMVKQCVCGPVT
ncbi:hypothetical protein HID58_019092, partial [Brassica napus]